MGNATKDVAHACDRLLTCTFDALDELGDIAYGCNKEFVVEYSCGVGEPSNTISTSVVPQTLTLDCSSSIADEKVDVCHKAGKKGKEFTMTISRHAVAAHMRHADELGECGDGSELPE